MLIDSTFSWKDQISNVSTKLSIAVGILYKLRPFVNIKILTNIYYVLIISHLVYAIEVWGSACDSHLTKIITIQNRAIRLMTFKDEYPVIPGPLHPSSPLFLKLELLKFKDIFILQTAKFIYKCVNGNIICNFNQWFKLNCEVYPHKTRSNYDISLLVNTNNLYIPYSRTTHYGLKLIKVRGPKLWNSLPFDLRSLKSLSSFKISLKNYLLKSY